MLGALYWAASHLDLPTLVDGGYEGAGIGLDVDNRAYNALPHGLGERGFAVLTGRTGWSLPGMETVARWRVRV